jgi:hypothetical protein
MKKNYLTMAILIITSVTSLCYALDVKTQGTLGTGDFGDVVSRVSFFIEAKNMTTGDGMIQGDSMSDRGVRMTSPASSPRRKRAMTAPSPRQRTRGAVRISCCPGTHRG